MELVLATMLGGVSDVNANVNRSRMLHIRFNELNLYSVAPHWIWEKIKRMSRYNLITPHADTKDLHQIDGWKGMIIS